MSDFEWDEANIAHIRRHNVTPEEAEQALADSVDLGWEVVDGETRLEAVGKTSRGRMLTVVSTDRAFRVRVVTAYDASAADKINYYRSKW